MFDLVIFNLIHQFTGLNFWADFIFHFIAQLFPYFLILILVLLALKENDFLITVLRAGLVGFLTRFLLAYPIQKFIPVERPFVLLDFEPLIPKEATASFPSSHLSFFFAVSTVVYFKNKKFGTFLYISSGLIGFARIYTGVHWPSDIVVGALLGLISGLVYQIILEKRN